MCIYLMLIYVNWYLGTSILNIPANSYKCQIVFLEWVGQIYSEKYVFWLIFNDNI